MSFKAYEEFAAGPLRFPIAGKVYEVPEVSYEVGLVLQKAEAGDAPELTADEQWRLLMGSAYDEMCADNVPVKALERAILTCLTDYRLGREMAEKVWEVGLDPEAFAPAGATEGSTSTAGASSTPTPASTSGTTSPKASTKAKAKAKAEPSPKSAKPGI